MGSACEFFCNVCGGTNITTQAYVMWNTIEQTWEVDIISDYPNTTCEDCQDECELGDRLVTDVKTLAQIAIHKQEGVKT